MKVGLRMFRGSLVAALVAVVTPVVVVTAVSVAVSPAAAQSASSIIVEGNRRIEADAVRSYFRPGPGGRLDNAAIDDGLKALIATNLFEDVRLSNRGGRLVVSVVENSVIARVAFEGNKKIKDEQLTAEVQSKPRGSLSRALVQADAQRIADIYRRAGRYDVRVNPQIIAGPNNRVDLVFEINEGDKTGVASVEFVGNQAYSSYRLKDVIKTRESNLLSFLSSGDVYDPDRVESDRDLIRRFYLKNGYADVQVVAALTEYDPQRKGFLITFKIEEGQQYRVSSVEFESTIASLDANSLRSFSHVSPGSIYNAVAVEKSIEEMSIEASRRGYAFATVRPRGDRNFETRTVALVFSVQEGARNYIERINVRGNMRTREYVIRREFDISEGDAYNRALVDRAERRLKNLDYFSSVKINTEVGSASDRVILNVDIEEKSTGEFSVSGGYSTSDGVLGEVSVSERNFLGRGLYAKAAVQYGQYARGYSLSFVEPYLLDYRVAFGVDLFQRQQLANSYINYDTKTTGFSTRLGFSLREDLTLQLRYSFYQQEIGLRDADLAYVSYPVQFELAQGTKSTSMVGYTLTYNTLDNNINPTSGFMIDLKQDFAGVGGDVTYLKTTIDAKHYSPLVSDIVGLLRVQGGILSKIGDDNIRMLDHFQMGPGLVRGFAPHGIGPRDTTFWDSRQYGDSLGGTMYWGASAELQMPFWFLPKEVGLKGAVYADVGSLYDYKGPTTFPGVAQPVPFEYDNTNTVRSSVGVGLIWQSPFGPLRFDYAVPLSKGKYDRVQEFRFGGGTTF